MGSGGGGGGDEAEGKSEGVEVGGESGGGGGRKDQEIRPSAIARRTGVGRREGERRRKTNECWNEKYMKNESGFKGRGRTMVSSSILIWSSCFCGH